MVRAADIFRRLLIALAILALLVVGVLVYAAVRLSREQPAPQLASDQEHFHFAGFPLDRLRGGKRTIVSTAFFRARRGRR